MPPRSELARRLDALVAELDPVAKREADPVGIVHEYADPDAQEIVALLAASLAFGNIVAIRRSIRRVLAAIEDPRHIARGKPWLRRRLRGFRHRVYTGDHVAMLLHRAHLLRRRHGTLGHAFAAGAEGRDVREALARFADALRGPGADRGMRHLVPDPRAGSACKRLWLYLRWMVRPADGLDLGLWQTAGVSPASLLIPVDTHVQRIANNLGLTSRADASWRTAEEITDALRTLDPDDPVRYDFALCHFGVSRACPSRRDDDACASCSLQTVCRHWGA